MKLKVQLIAHLASNAMFSKTSVELCLNDLVDKIGDVKNGASVKEALLCMAEATSLECVASQVRAGGCCRKYFKSRFDLTHCLQLGSY